MGKLYRGFLAILAVLAASCGDDGESSSQRIVKIGFEGEVQDVNNSLAPDLPAFARGTRITGWFSYELSALDRDPSPSVGSYRLEGAATVQVGGMAIEAQPDADWGYFAKVVSDGRTDGYPGDSVDQFQWVAAHTLAPGCEAEDVQVHFTLLDPSGQALASDALPRELILAAFPLTAVDIYALRTLSTGEQAIVYALRAQVTRIEDCPGSSDALSELCSAA
jgi:hypothetical protein